jgi:hypothetical protein
VCDATLCSQHRETFVYERIHGGYLEWPVWEQTLRSVAVALKDDKHKLQLRHVAQATGHGRASKETEDTVPCMSTYRRAGFGEHYNS